MPAAVAIAALFGAGWGALVPALVHRYAVDWPADRPRPGPRRSCTACGAPVALWRRPACSRHPGRLARCPAWRCAVCGTRFGPPAALTVPLTATVCALLALAVGARPELLAYVVVGAVGVLLAFVDIAVLRLPDRLVLTAFATCVVVLPVAALAAGQAGPLRRAVLGAAVSQAVYLGLALLPGSRLGWGDVKLSGVLGLLLGWSGWYALVAGLALPPLLSLPAAVTRLAAGRAGRTAPVPYGPAMLAGALVAVVVPVLRRGGTG